MRTKLYRSKGNFQTASMGAYDMLLDLDASLVLGSERHGGEQRSVCFSRRKGTGFTFYACSQDLGEFELHTPPTFYTYLLFST